MLIIAVNNNFNVSQDLRVPNTVDEALPCPLMTLVAQSQASSTTMEKTPRKCNDLTKMKKKKSEELNKRVETAEKREVELKEKLAELESVLKKKEDEMSILEEAMTDEMISCLEAAALREASLNQQVVQMEAKIKQNMAMKATTTTTTSTTATTTTLTTAPTAATNQDNAATGAEAMRSRLARTIRRTIRRNKALPHNDKRVLDQRMSFYGFAITKLVPSVGNCQFESISHSVYGTISEAHQIRFVVYLFPLTGEGLIASIGSKETEIRKWLMEQKLVSSKNRTTTTTTITTTKQSILFHFRLILLR